LADSLIIFFGENFTFNIVNISSAMIHLEWRKYILHGSKKRGPFFGSFASYTTDCLASVAALVPVAMHAPALAWVLNQALQTCPRRCVCLRICADSEITI
jgi:hypothetical protein